MKEKNYTWVIKNEKGEVIKHTNSEYEEVNALYYGKLVDIVKIITYKEWKEMATIEIVNNDFDKINHKQFTKEQLEEML